MLVACQSATLVKAPESKTQNDVPVHRLPTTDPDGPAFKAKEQSETVKKATVESSPAPAVQENTEVAALPRVEAAPAAPSPGLAQPRRLENAKYKIGILLPLSGRRELLGRELLDAAQIAVFDLADKDFVIYPFDTKGTEAGAAAAAQKAVRTGVDLILGPLLASSVRAVRPVAASAGVSVVAFSNSRSRGGWGFHFGFRAPATSGRHRRLCGWRRAIVMRYWRRMTLMAVPWLPHLKGRLPNTRRKSFGWNTTTRLRPILAVRQKRSRTTIAGIRRC